MTKPGMSPLRSSLPKEHPPPAVQIRKATYLESQRIKSLLTLRLDQLSREDWEHEDEADAHLEVGQGRQTDVKKATKARMHHERDKVLSKEQSQLKSGKAPSMFIISLSLKTSRVSQGLKEKAPTPYATIHGP